MLFKCLELKIYRLMNSIVNASLRMRQVIPNWYNYRYDVGLSTYYIRDGGNDMFNTGNRVNFIVYYCKFYRFLRVLEKFKFKEKSYTLQTLLFYL